MKISTLNAELQTHSARLSRLRPGTPGHSAARQKALKLLTQRKQLDAQRDQLTQQSFNMSQAQDMTANLQNVMTTVDALKTTNKTLKKQYGKVDIDKIEQLQDEMQDLMEVGREIQDSISRAYDVPEDVDEDELDAELEMLGEEMQFESAMGESEGLPGFMVPEAGDGQVPQFIDEAPESTGKVKEAAGGLG